MQIPDWAYQKIGHLLEGLIDEDYDIDPPREKTKGELYYDPAYGKVWTLIATESPNGTAAAEEVLNKYFVPYDKWFTAGIEVEQGREWVRYEYDGTRHDREVLDNDHPNYVELFEARERRIKRSPNGSEDFANKRFVSSMKLWWDDHKPLEPPLAECTPNLSFEEATDDLEPVDLSN